MATPVPLCTHVKPSGATCGSPAVSGTALCYHHSTVKTTLARVVPLDKVPYGAHSPIPFVFPEDRASIQINFFLLLKAFNEKRIDQRAATIMHRMLRAMSANLGAKPLTEDRAEAAASPAANHVATAHSSNIAGDHSSAHQQPDPESTGEAQAPASATVPPSSPQPPLPPSSHGPIDPSSVFSAIYPPPKAPSYPLDPTGRKPMGVLSAEGQRILSMFSSQPD